MSNPAESIGLSDEIQSLSKRRMSRFARASASPAQKGLHFREGLFNGREIRRIGRQEQEAIRVVMAPEVRGALPAARCPLGAEAYNGVRAVWEPVSETSTRSRLG